MNAHGKLVTAHSAYTHTRRECFGGGSHRRAHEAAVSAHENKEQMGSHANFNGF